MPSLHLTKVALGCRDLEALRARVVQRASGGELRVATRMRPRRAEELVGGNLYWIVKHRMVASQRILRFEDRDDCRIDIVCEVDLVAVGPVPKRAHQGWRYLEGAFAPTAGGQDPSGVTLLPPRLYGALTALALV